MPAQRVWQQLPCGSVQQAAVKLVVAGGGGARGRHYYEARRRLQRLFPDLLLVRLTREVEHRHDRAELVDHARVEWQVRAQHPRRADMHLAAFERGGVSLPGQRHGGTLGHQVRPHVHAGADVREEHLPDQDWVGAAARLDLRPRGVARREDGDARLAQRRQLCSQACEGERVAEAVQSGRSRHTLEVGGSARAGTIHAPRRRDPARLRHELFERGRPHAKDTPRAALRDRGAGGRLEASPCVVKEAVAVVAKVVNEVLEVDVVGRVACVSDGPRCVNEVHVARAVSARRKAGQCGC
mmetsp:Transcript_30788/g.90798  ORF Transcript_30788/g.90798 Transcript_30788/m.90798 type:complete len:297 (+) Transcript_30788:316-1206(+)